MEIGKNASTSSPLPLRQVSATTSPPSTQPSARLNGSLPHPFMTIPTELRLRVFELLVVSDKPIVPKLCTKHKMKKENPSSAGCKAIFFHDHSYPDDHDMFNTCNLAITRVSKKIREESLSVFYGHNTFGFGNDLLAYFEYLEQTSLSRFALIRRVELPTIIRNSSTEKILYHVSNVLDRQRLYREKCPITDRASLDEAPFYTAGGLFMIAIPILLLKLSSAISETEEPTQDELKSCNPSNSSPPSEDQSVVLDTSSSSSDAHAAPPSPQPTTFDRKLVLHVVNKDIFAFSRGFAWIPAVIEGMGMELKLVESPGAISGTRMLWTQSLQKRDLGTSTPVSIATTTTESVENAESKFLYYRVVCKDDVVDYKEVEWCRVNLPFEKEEFSDADSTGAVVGLELSGSFLTGGSVSAGSLLGNSVWRQPNGEFIDEMSIVEARTIDEMSTDEKSINDESVEEEPSEE